LELDKIVKILWLTIDRRYRIASQFDWLREEVSKSVEVDTIFRSTEPNLAGEFSRKVMDGVLFLPRLITEEHAEKNYDFVMCDAFFAYTQEDLSILKCPKAMIIEDNHGAVPKWQVDVGKKRGIDIIFARGKQCFYDYHPNADKHYKVFWLPFAVNVEMFYDYKLERDKVRHFGVYHPAHYPYRTEIVERLKDVPYFEVIKRPPDLTANGAKRKERWPIKEDYARLISSTKLCVTCGSRHNGPVAKFFEIASCGTPILSNYFPDLKNLGFAPEENIFAYEAKLKGRPHIKDDIVKLVDDLYRNEDELRRVGEAGKKLMLERHTFERRAEYFIETVGELISENTK
jgi:hypothetical protein